MAATLFGLPDIAHPAPVSASSCTGWTSKTKPPRSIKVLRTRSGRVETVGFRTYVAEVMASGEWPSQLRKATLEAGAVATKQYAWYYALQGNHRPGYVKRGRCYDVRDDTVDQLYRPARAEPTAKQSAAIDRTWALSLRKRGMFFLTGYRRGTIGRCGADANGWKLFARSVEACAAKGWGFKRILRHYLDPDLAFVWTDKLGPLLAKPTFDLRAGTTWTRGVATVGWRPMHKGADVTRYRLQRKVADGRWRRIGLDAPKARVARARVKPGKVNRFRVAALDGKGRRGPWAYSPRRKAAIRGPVGTTLSTASTASGPVQVRTRFRGRSIALLAAVGPGMGTAKVRINGRKVAVVDLDRPRSADRAVVWAKNFPRGKRRSIAVVAVGADSRVDFEGFVVLR